MIKDILFKRMKTSTFITSVAVFALLCVIPVSVAYARTNNSDPVMALAQTNDNVIVKLNIPSLATATSTILVKLADTTNFKHFNSTGVLEISEIRVSWTTDVQATTTLKFGLVASTSASGALSDVYWFDEVSFSNFTNTGQFNRQEKVLTYYNSVVKLGASGGVPTGFLSNDFATSTNTFATTSKVTSAVGLSSNGGGSFPAVGDLVMRVYDMKGTATTSVTTIYRSK